MRLSDIAICAKSDARTAAGRFVRRRLGKPVYEPLPSRVPVRRIKNMLLREGFAVTNGAPSWFYTAYDRGDADPLTNFSLRHISETRPKDAEILVTGCGTGITAFYLADAGFSHVSGVDLLPECIRVAEVVKEEGSYDGTSFAVGDGFKPELARSYDVITALHWVFSAWMGNYGNEPSDENRAHDDEFREQLLDDFLEQYAPHLNPGGDLMIELTDAVTDYRLDEDHHLGEEAAAIYPIRHTPEQVARCAAHHGLEVADKKLCVSYGHHPRTLYSLRKRDASG